MTTTTSNHPSLHAHGRSLRTILGEGLEHAVTTLFQWHERARQRRALASLSAHELRDIGISAREARTEADKPFWRG